MQKKISWEAFTNNDRNMIIDKVKNAISSYDGCILNFNIFSDLALSLNIEIEEFKSIQLFDSLSKILSISEDKEITINQASKKEILIFMNISFGTGKGNMKVKIPAVPG